MSLSLAMAAALIPFSPAPENRDCRRSLNSLRQSPVSKPRASPLIFRRRSNLYLQSCSSPNWKATGNVSSNQVKLEDEVDDGACELVNGAEIIIGEGQDSIRAYLLKAVKNNNEIGVLLLSDVFGFEDSSTRDFAYRVACNGYNVLVPDMFRGNPWKKGRPESEFENWSAAQHPERVANDIDSSAKWLAEEFAAAGISNKLAVVGFSYGGGRLVETLAQDERESFGTGVCFYGAHVDASLAKAIKVPILFICGGDRDVQGTEKIIEGSRAVVYKGRGDGFAHRPESLEEDEDAEDAFELMKRWLHESLAVGRDYA